MSMVMITIIVSFLLESIISNFVLIDSLLWLPLFTLVSLVIVVPYFNRKEANYLKLCAITGLFYDIVFTDTLCFNMLLFVLLGIVISKVMSIINFNFISIVFFIPIIIIFYRILSYLIICFSGFLIFDWVHLGESIYSSLLINILYGVILYFITSKLSKKYHIYKID